MADDVLPPLTISKSTQPPSVTAPSTASSESDAGQGSRQYDRYINLTVIGSKGSIDLSSLRIVFNIKQWTTQAPNIAAIRVYNLSDDTANKIKTEFQDVRLDAGYQDHHGLLFSGNVKQFRKGRENPVDTFLDLFAADGDRGYNGAVTNKALAAGSTPKDHLDAHMAEFKKFGLSLGYIGVDLSKPKYPRGVSLFGMTRDLVRTLALSAGGTWSIQDGKVQILPKGGGLPGDVIKLNSQTGLIGMPTQTIDGIMVRCLINCSIVVGSKIQINQKDIQTAQYNLSQTGATEDGGLLAQQAALPQLSTDGIYVVLYIEKNGDTRGTPWYFDLTCIASQQLGNQPTNFSGSYYIPKAQGSDAAPPASTGAT